MKTNEKKDFVEPALKRQDSLVKATLFDGRASGLIGDAPS